MHITLYFYGGIEYARRYDYTDIRNNITAQGYTITDVKMYTPRSIQNCDGCITAVTILYYE